MAILSVYGYHVTDICRKIVAERVAGGIGCGKGAAAIGYDGTVVCMAIAEEGNDGIEQETAASRVHFNAGRDQDS
ncbi:hypothetical protein B296_00000162 [Ensete ventricosum]|uniref:Uncharacterized protein n=1 Tax=Ensete ventricosum TaxID=4639 RepID=A0A426YPT1_ENSVE|nr:hypothetical protein B296_00000162 [Ensete ventricosum]